MNKLIKPGRSIFATGIIMLGILCILSKDFIVGRPPSWPLAWQVNPVLAYLSASILMIAAMAIVVNKKTRTAALCIAILIFLLSVLRHLPHFMNDWLNAYKSMALFGGALIVASSAAAESNRIQSPGINRGYLLAGSVLLAAFFIAAGYAHFKFAAFVKDFIPAYIPFRMFWTYFCGICLIAGGTGLLIPQARKWAALLSGVMVLGWFILLHIPRFLSNVNDASDRMGLFESFTFAGIFFVLAGVFQKKQIAADERFKID